MPRIAGVDIPLNKQVEIGLTYIYGICRLRSNEIVTETEVERDTRGRDLSEAEVSRLREFIDVHYLVEGDLRREIAQNIQRLVGIGSYRGTRHRRNPPLRGQRTKTNARTRRGRR